MHQTAGMWEKDQQNATVNISTKKKITFIKLDGGIFMDANTKDNTWGIKAEATKTPVNLDKYTGVYSSKQIPIKVTFKKEDDTLVAEAEGQEKLTLVNSEKDTFSFDAGGLKFIFDTTKNEMTLKQGGGEFIFTKEK